MQILSEAVGVHGLAEQRGGLGSFGPRRLVAKRVGKIVLGRRPLLRKLLTGVDLERVLGTSARKPPLSDTLLWATLSLAHPFKIEVILSKRVDVLPKQRGREAQNIVVDHMAFVQLGKITIGIEG